MNFVFVLSTIGSTKLKELERLIDSINSLKIPLNVKLSLFHNSQGKNNQYFYYIKEYLSKNVDYICTSDLGKGLSRGRNNALDCIDLYFSDKDLIFFFPDDDCFYPENFLIKFLQIKGQKYQLVAGAIYDETKTKQLSYTKSKKTISINNSKDVFRNLSSISFGICYTKNRFDESFGIGSKFNSSEEFDFILKAIKDNSKCIYDPSLKIFHPDPEKIDDLKHKVFRNSIGHGAFFFKYLNIYSIYFVFLQPFLSFFKYSLFFDKKNMINAIYSLFGRVKGFFWAN